LLRALRGSVFRKLLRALRGSVFRKLLRALRGSGFRKLLRALRGSGFRKLLRASDPGYKKLSRIEVLIPLGFASRAGKGRSAA
jgi:hypothetical protein